MTTPVLGLEEWESAQAQPEVTVNEAVRWLECFASLVVASQAVNDPPSGSDGDRYIVGAIPTGAWAGHALQIALFMGDAWDFRVAPEGAIAWVLDEDAAFRYLSGVWTEEVDDVGGSSTSQAYQLSGSILIAVPSAPRFQVPVAGALVRWALHAEGGPGDAVVDVRLGFAVNSPPTGPGDSICDGSPPTISADVGSTQDCSAWAVTAVDAFEVIEFVLLSVDTNITALHLQLTIEPPPP